MVTTRRSWPTWLRYGSVMLALSAPICGNGVQNSTQVDRAVILETSCPVKTVWEVEAEVFREPVCLETRWGRGKEEQRQQQQPASTSSDVGGYTTSTIASTAAVGAGTPAAVAEQEADHDADADSLLDSSNFLSFEDWKKQNLAKVGQSAENVGGSRRAAAVGKEGRRQPGINNALDSLGDDGEIELDFGGFGAETPEASPTAWGTPVPSQYVDPLDGEQGGDVHTQSAPQPDVSRRKDAGTTCKERFNYASFDCAATVLKTNPECKGSSAVLVENKDSYMLNECRANNKFLILELCDDILVDTVVLANYEFFSSIFHTVRVSVSDRYPAKPDQWKELGVFEARNTREVQAFAVENSLIWARYLRVEFLTHYGHEFYCPVSLIRVHGTTMMEEYKHDESVNRAEPEVVETVETVKVSGQAEAQHIESTIEEIAIESKEYEQIHEICPNPLMEVESLLLGHSLFAPETCALGEQTAGNRTEKTVPPAKIKQPSGINSTAIPGDGASASQSGSAVPPKVPEDTRKTGDSAKPVAATPDTPVAVTDSSQQDSTVESTGKSTTNTKEEQQNSPPPESIRPTSTQPPSPNPTTQESFFKSVHKRLQMLESNSTLSLLYIEEQSRILRDAFNKVEKRQLAKTSTFLENLNTTVLSELKEFREQYDHVWKSVAFEFEHQRMRYHQEVHSLSAQLGVLADELVFQKRVTMIQSIMVLCCFAVVLFSRGSVGTYMEFPRVQRMVARSYSLRSSSPPFESPSASPGSTRPTSSYQERSAHRRNLSDSSSGDSANSPEVTYIPPTPTSDVSREFEEEEKLAQPPSPGAISVPALGTPQFRSHSTPPVLNTRSSELDMSGQGEDNILPSAASTVSEESPQIS
ncbi:uncharacterized protein N7496_003722 [Penicillium cataractarum]|uniref:SUN domain-containing protein n=1 Tax=Penicillium cataractarum TaxID=2100454 RepID=A0A9W9VHT9_9EURO|nr:uncharacterized protein N7496_003722 [Penicillium cataractarum]KAJ5381294.1 hypothetical protein N7496_003722 [Penicillium cataractarum]